MHVEVLGDEVELRLPGMLTLRAEFVAEGYYAEGADGDPPEQDLFQIDVTMPESTAGVEPFSYPLLLPATPPDGAGDLAESDASAWLHRYLLTLAQRLSTAPPAEWETICDASRAWEPGALLTVEA